MPMHAHESAAPARAFMGTLPRRWTGAHGPTRRGGAQSRCLPPRDPAPWLPGADATPSADPSRGVDDGERTLPVWPAHARGGGRAALGLLLPLRELPASHGIPGDLLREL